jgi:hypothetical protein
MVGVRIESRDWLAEPGWCFCWRPYMNTKGLRLPNIPCIDTINCDYGCTGEFLVDPIR